MANVLQIKEHMEVVASDGEHVGIIDRIEGDESIKLTKDDPAADGQHHIIPAAWVSSVDEHVHLSKPSADVFRNWVAI